MTIKTSFYRLFLLRTAYVHTQPMGCYWSNNTHTHTHTQTRTFTVITDACICLNISFSVERRSLAESLCICRMDDAESCFILSSRNEVDRTAAVRITINTANR